MKIDSKHIYDLLLKGETVSEIRNKYCLSQKDWQRLTSRVEFTQLMFSPKLVPDLLKIKEIETDLFNLLEIDKPSLDVKKRINSLQIRYSTFTV